MTKQIALPDITLYTTKEGDIQLEVNVLGETVWLTQKQMALLFGKDVRTISEHINNIFAEAELDQTSVVRKFRITAADGKQYNTLHYNLDVIISVGYRVRSKQGTHFRQWATQTLKKYLIEGYIVNERRLTQKGFADFEQTLTLLQKTLLHRNAIDTIGTATLEIITQYAKTWQLLLAYDESSLVLPDSGHKSIQPLLYEDACMAIKSLKQALTAANEASDLFAKEQGGNLSGILGNLEQTFDGEPLYKTVEEKASHLLYFVIKDHPFYDGNKRIASFLFLLYLNQQKIIAPFNENGLTALTLLIAESEPRQKEILIRLVIHLLMNTKNTC